MRGAIGGGGPVTIITFADLHVTALAVGGACTSGLRLLSFSVAVGPFLALVVSAQPMGCVTFDTLGHAVRRTSSAGGARAMVAFALFGAAALRVSSVGPSLSLHLALFVTILPRKTRAVV